MSKKIYTGVSDIKQYLIRPFVFKINNSSAREYLDMALYLRKNISDIYAISHETSSVNSDFQVISYRYYLFKESIDAMQFKLAFGNADEVKMWKSGLIYTVFV